MGIRLALWTATRSPIRSVPKEATGPGSFGRWFKQMMKPWLPGTSTFRCGEQPRIQWARKRAALAEEKTGILRLHKVCRSTCVPD